MAKKEQSKSKSTPQTGKAKSGSQKKSGSQSENVKKKSSKLEQQRIAEQEQRDAARKQVVSVLLFAAALLLLCIIVVPSGVKEGEMNPWQWMKNALFGLFGICSFALPIMMFYSAVSLSKEHFGGNLGLRLAGIGSIAVCLSSLFHIGAHDSAYLHDIPAMTQISEAWKTGLSAANGGVVGAAVGSLFARLFGQAGSIITLLIVLFAVLMLSTGTSLNRFFAMLRKPFSRAADFTQHQLEKRQKEELLTDFEEDDEPVIRPKQRKKRQNSRSEAYEYESFSEEEGFVPPDPDEMRKTNPQYKRPKSEKVFRTGSNDFFCDDYDPVPEKTDEEYVPFEGEEELPEIPSFMPMPDVFSYGKEVQDKTGNGAEETEASEENQTEDIASVENGAVSSSEIVDLIDKAASVKEEEKPVQEMLEEPEEPKKQYVLPGINCLAESLSGGDAGVKEELTANAAKLVETLHNFNIETKIVDIARGPSVTRYEIQPAPGIKISRIAGLADDIAMNLAASGVRIEAPIPNKAAVGIEIPNKIRTTVTLREIIDSPQFKTAKSKLNVALGKDISGNVTCTDIAKMPHLLIAGTTGSGKSVCLNSMIISILFNSTPDEVKLIMIDPKQVEFTVYNGIPHLMVPVVSDARKAAGALAWAVSEMLKRYKMFSEKGVRDIKGYNKLAERTPDMTPMYQICIFIDELSDLMMVAANEVEDSICRLAQMARAAGMHLVIATQRPSVDVITGIIKANIPSRIALYVSSQVDSRTILDASGADKLLGNGDMLFNPVGVSKPVRLQGCFVSDEEVERVVNFIKTQEECEYDNDVMEEIERQAVLEKKKGNSLPDADSSPDSGADKETMDAIAVVVEHQTASTTLLQRKLKIGYAKAARIMDELEEKGVIGPFEGSKPRRVLMSKQQFAEMRALNEDSAAAFAEDGE